MPCIKQEQYNNVEHIQSEAQMQIKNIGVIGAGQMGNGIAHVLSLGGYKVILNDIGKDILEKASDTIKKNLERQVNSGKISSEESHLALQHIKYSVSIEEFNNVDLVIEAATEDEPTKQKILSSLLPQIQDHTILTSNTSSISITRLASCTDRPEKFMGFHFMNPVPIMQLVELIKGIATNQDTYESCLQVVEKLGKTAASAEDFPAFIVNRILMPMINEAVYALYEGVGSVKAIDTSMKLGANHPMGPLELADFIGLDLSLIHI